MNKTEQEQGRIFIIGANGMLGRALTRTFLPDTFFHPDGFEKRLRLFDKRPMEKQRIGFCDITDISSVKQTLSDLEREDIVFLTAAYTDVDRAEKAKEPCFTINQEGVQNVANIVAAKGARLFAFSTDYVFSGKEKDREGKTIPRTIPYREGDKRGDETELCRYGSSKVLMEDTLRRIREEKGLKYCVVRTAGLFGSREKKNLIDAVVDLYTCEEREPLPVVSDQRRSITSVHDLADILSCLTNIWNHGGSLEGQVFHIANSGESTPYEVASFVEHLLQPSAGEEKSKLIPVSYASYQEINARREQPLAARPLYSALSLEKLTNFDPRLKRLVRSWQSAVATYLEKQYGIDAEFFLSGEDTSSSHVLASPLEQTRLYQERRRGTHVEALSLPPQQH